HQCDNIDHRRTGGYLAAGPETKFTDMTQTLLHTEKLSIGYHKKTGAEVIASGIDLSLKKGSLVSIVGANGIGKSTLLRTLTGIQQPLAGKISLAGHPLESYNPSELAKNLSLVLTEKLPPSSLTVFELISLGRQPYKIGRASCRERV